MSIIRPYFLILLVLFFGACSNDDEPAIPTDDMEAHFEQLWSDFNATYSYFPIKGIDWDSVYDANRSKVINGQTSESELAAIFAEMTLALKDLHVMFAVGSNVHQYNNRDDFLSNSPENARNYLEQDVFNSSSLLYGNVEGMSVLYVQIKNLSNSGNFGPLQNLLSELPGKDGFIIDLRNNGGGNDAIAKGFVNRLTTEERIHERVRFRNGPNRDDFEEWIDLRITPDNPLDYDNPIIVLTNRGVVSSAESFVTMLDVLPNTTILGDTTRGSTGNPVELRLSNGWRYRISRWQAATVDGLLIEDNGIPPDSVVINTDESIEQGKDLILEAALEILQ